MKLKQVKIVTNDNCKDMHYDLSVNLLYRSISRAAVTFNRYLHDPIYGKIYNRIMNGEVKNSIITSVKG